MDSNGNVHIVYADADNSDNDRALWYTMLDNFGNTLIDDTPITPAGDYDSTRPAIVVDSQDKVHVAWRDKRWDNDDADDKKVTYTKLDLYLDDRDGGPADPAAITLVDDSQLTAIGNSALYGIRLAVDSGDLPTLASNLTLAFWETVTLTFPVDVDLGIEGWTITNTAALSSAELVTPKVNSDVLNVLAPDVSVRQTASPNLLEPGQVLAFSISFGNASGALTATNVTLTNTVPLSLTGVSCSNSGASLTPLPGPDYAWQVDDLSPGEGGVITLTGTVDPALQTPGFVTNTALITTVGVFDGNPANNESFNLAVVMQADAIPELDTNTGRSLDLGQTAIISAAHLHTTLTCGAVQLDGSNSKYGARSNDFSRSCRVISD